MSVHEVEKSVGLFILFILFVCFFVFVFPLTVIWSLNTLFPVLGIPFTFKTYFASLFLLMAVSVRELRMTSRNTMK